MPDETTMLHQCLRDKYELVAKVKVLEADLERSKDYECELRADNAMLREVLEKIATKTWDAEGPDQFFEIGSLARAALQGDE